MRARLRLEDLQRARDVQDGPDATMLWAARALSSGACTEQTRRRPAGVACGAPCSGTEGAVALRTHAGADGTLNPKYHNRNPKT